MLTVHCYRSMTKLDKRVQPNMEKGCNEKMQRNVGKRCNGNLVFQACNAKSIKVLRNEHGKSKETL